MNSTVYVDLNEEITKFYELIRKARYSVNNLSKIPVSRMSFDEKEKLVNLLMEIMKLNNESTAMSLDLHEKVHYNVKKSEMMPLPSDITPSMIRSKQRPSVVSPYPRQF